MVDRRSLVSNQDDGEVEGSGEAEGSGASRGFGAASRGGWS